MTKTEKTKISEEELKWKQKRIKKSEYNKKWEKSKKRKEERYIKIIDRRKSNWDVKKIDKLRRKN